ncbi:glycosyltransferase family 1 protein [Candidatus Bathyarchaeota archaeon]|nr:glycosyltransferase family 1 protein [Candidatus Bathyarchaeota archaeon]
MGFFYSGGGERTVLSQAAELMRRGYKVNVYAPVISESCFPELMKGLNIVETADLIPKSLPFRNAAGMIYSSLSSPLREIGKHDVVIAHGQPSNWIGMRLKRKYGTPYISYLHQVNRFFKQRKVDQASWGTEKNLMLLNILHKKNLVLQGLDRLSVTYADAVLTNSQWIRRQVHEYYGVDPIVCYPGVGPRFLQSSKRDESRRYVLTTNRHYPQKRIDYLLQCMKGVVAEYEDVQCVITGEFTGHTSALKKIVADNGLEEVVKFTGSLSEAQLIEKYTDAYLYTYTSPEEDFGLGPIEAGACGTPAIVWDYAGPRETVIDNVTGFRVKPYDIQGMVEKHIKLLDDPSRRDRMGKAAHEHVLKKYTWRSHCDTLEKTITGLI